MPLRGLLLSGRRSGHGSSQHQPGGHQQPQLSHAAIPVELPQWRRGGVQIHGARPFGGIPGIFLKLTQEAGLNYNVSIDTISSATLNGTWGNATNLPVISASKWDHVVLQEQ